MIQIYDTTLRDGTQRTDISLSLIDKLNIARRLDDLGVAFIEGGWPGSNPKDAEFFARCRYTWKHARITAFGATCAANKTPEDDANIQALLEAQTAIVQWSARPPSCTSTKSCAPHWRTTCVSSRKPSRTSEPGTRGDL